MFRFKASTKLTGQALGIQKKVSFETSELRELAIAIQNGSMKQAEIIAAINYFAGNIDKHVNRMVDSARQTAAEWNETSLQNNA